MTEQCHEKGELDPFTSASAKTNTRHSEANPGLSVLLMMEIGPGVSFRFYFQIYFKKDLFCERMSGSRQADLQSPEPAAAAGKFPFGFIFLLG